MAHFLLVVPTANSCIACTLQHVLLHTFRAEIWPLVVIRGL